MGQQPRLRVFEGGQGPQEQNRKTESGCRLVVQVAREVKLSAQDVVSMRIANSAATRHSKYNALSYDQQRMVYPFIEQFLSNGIIPEEDLIIRFIDNICGVAATITLPPLPHNGDLSKVKLTAENENNYNQYLRALRKNHELLEIIFSTYLECHKAGVKSLANTPPTTVAPPSNKYNTKG